MFRHSGFLSMKRMTRLLLATDFSFTSRRALDTALGLARSQNARLTISRSRPAPR
jgi:hypothetical protein